MSVWNCVAGVSHTRPECGPEDHGVRSVQSSWRWLPQMAGSVAVQALGEVGMRDACMSAYGQRDSPT